MSADDSPAPAASTADPAAAVATRSDDPTPPAGGHAADPDDGFDDPRAAPPDAAPDGRPHTLTGDVRRHEGFRSSHLAATHDVLVYLPPGYDDEPARRYPVLYLQDGQNLFDEATAFSQEWQVDETAQRLIEAGEIEPLIIVGIANAGDRRIDEYTPTRDRRHRAGGGASRYGRMLVEELKPFVDATYRTRPDPASTGLGGSSLGGLLSLYLGLQYSGLFWRLAVLSPSVWWDDRFIVRRVRLLSFKPPLRIWLSVGTHEADGVVEAARALRDALVERGWREGRDLAFAVVEGARHEEAAWAGQVEAVLRYLFPPE
jgi:predicted alpha/beta superfamily hydrolase